MSKYEQLERRMKIFLNLILILSFGFVFGCSVKKPGLDPIPPAPVRSPSGGAGWIYEFERGDQIDTASGWQAQLDETSTTENLIASSGWTAEVSIE